MRCGGGFPATNRFGTKVYAAPTSAPFTEKDARLKWTAKGVQVKSGSKIWIGAAAGLPTAQLAATLLIPQGYGLTVVSDLIATLMILAVALAFAANAVASHGRLRSVWILQIFCWVFWLIDQGGWTVYDVILHKPMPDMFSGDIVLFLADVPLLAGLLLRPHLEPSRNSVRLGMLDFLQLMLWWVFVYVYLVTCWQYVSVNSAIYNRNFDRLYMIGVGVLVSVLALLSRQSTGAWRRFYTYFLGAMFFNALAVVAENTAIEANKYYSGSWYDVPYIASIGAFVVVAVKGRNLSPTPETLEDRKYNSGMAGVAMVALLSLPVTLVLTVLEGTGPAGVIRFRLMITAITMLVMTVLVLVKQRRLNEDLKQKNQMLEQASMTDPLTGIRNRRYFSETIESDIAQVLRAHATRQEAKRDLVFYLIDLDNFKEVNDAYGHDAGDRVLVETARRIGTVVRDSDVLLRWGGEEFLIISRFSDRREADTVAFRVMQAVRSDPFTIDGSVKIRRTCSIGWAAFPWIEEEPGTMGYAEVLNMADRALGQAKRAGKDQAIGMTPPASSLNVRRGADGTPAPAEWRSKPADAKSFG